MQKIAATTSGLAAIQGQAWPTASRKCLDGRPVCFWGIEVQEWSSSGKNGHWETIYSFESGEEFLVIDGTGICAIKPQSAQLELTELVINQSKMTDFQKYLLSQPLPLIADYFKTETKKSFLGFRYKARDRYRLIEKKILAGGPVFARGHYCTEEESTQSVAVGDLSSYRNYLRKISSPYYQSKMFDTNRNGQLSEDELTNGHAAAANYFLRNDDLQSIKVSGQITATTTHSLIIGDSHRNYLINRMDIFSIIQVVGGLAVLGIGIYIWSLQKF